MERYPEYFRNMILRWANEEGDIESYNPSNGELLGKFASINKRQYNKLVDESTEAFENWRMVPAPKRGEVVRQIGEAFRKNQRAIAEIITLETGKIISESMGEVQEIIDICDFSVGLSRQLYGLTIASERPKHRMIEQWHPLGPVGVITAFNFPGAVLAWNAMVAMVCGNTVIWKPSELTPLTSVAVWQLIVGTLVENGYDGVFRLVLDNDGSIGELISKDKRIPLVSFTGSVKTGKKVAKIVSGRLGKTLLELGGNNAVIVHNDADLELATRGILFGAVGTSGQRCTTTRRLFVHEDVAEELTERLIKAYGEVSILNPMDERANMGPLINLEAVINHWKALDIAVEEGGEILYGNLKSNESWVHPAIVSMPSQTSIVREETFSPILYIMKYKHLEEAVKLNNEVSQGLSSSIFTDSMKTAEQFISAMGSDCGIANVNIGTSGAEIGGAFGGEKETGGGRESGSDSWKAYMRRQTNTINWSDDLPLAQGIKFGE